MLLQSHLMLFTNTSCFVTHYKSLKLKVQAWQQGQMLAHNN